MYLILYPDMTLITLVNEPRKFEHEGGTRFFVCDEMAPVIDISKAFAVAWRSDNPNFPSSIKEVTDEIL